MDSGELQVLGDRSTPHPQLSPGLYTYGKPSVGILAVCGGRCGGIWGDDVYKVWTAAHQVLVGG